MTSIENTNNNHPFPFHNLTNNDFKTQNDNCNIYDIGRLSHLQLNPFQTNSNSWEMLRMRQISIET
jgi:hypothetical protein